MPPVVDRLDDRLQLDGLLEQADHVQGVQPLLLVAAPAQQAGQQPARGAGMG
jgi:hypothetical protein